MSDKLKNGLRTAGIIILIIIVSAIFAYRKYYRKEVRREIQYEQNKDIIENQRLQQQKESELRMLEEQRKNDSICQAQRDELEAKKKETEAIIKALEEENR